MNSNWLIRSVCHHCATQNLLFPLVISDVFQSSEHFCFLIGAWLPPRASGEGTEALRPAHQQQGLPAVFHPHTGGPAWFLHEGPRQCGLTHHDSAAEQVGVCHRCPKAPAVRPHRPQPWEQEPPQAAAPQVGSRHKTRRTEFNRSFKPRTNCPPRLLFIFLPFLT